MRDKHLQRVTECVSDIGQRTTVDACDIVAELRDPSSTEAMSRSPLETMDHPGIFLPRRRDWFHRAAFALPSTPETADRGEVRNVLLDLIEAGAGLEFSRGELARVLDLAQGEYDALNPPSSTLPPEQGWGGVTVTPVYCAFYECVIWTRTVIDRFEEPVKRAIQPHDPALWKKLQQIRSESGGKAFEEARRLAGVSLHRYSPPYAGCGAKLVNGKLIFPVVDDVDDKDPWKILRFEKGRRVDSVTDEYWNAVGSFLDSVLDEFYPKPTDALRNA